MNPALRHSAAHVFVDSLSAPVLADADAHHLLRVLRVRTTDVISVSDGRGQWVPATLDSDGQVRVTGPVADVVPLPSVTIGVAIPKGDRPEWIVQKLTELGVRTVAFMHCERSVVQWEGERASRQLDRLRRIAREAAMQCRSVWLPAVPDVQTFADLVTVGDVVVADPEGGPLRRGTGTVLIGPEGGFTDAERAAGTARASVSSQILRVETAAIAVAALLLSDPCDA